MSSSRSFPRLRDFAQGERGSITAEFLIWAPLVFYVGVAMFVLSYYLATASEVQEVAHELARSSFGLVNVDLVEGDLCEAMNDELPDVVSRMAIVNVGSFSPVEACPAMPDADGYITVSVEYDLTGTALHSLGRIIGFDFAPVVRSSTVQF
jgi:hypothetical protein